MIYSKNIFIFSDEIGVGKTTTLEFWLKNQKNIGGFLSPKIEGKRFSKNLETDEIRPMETSENGLKIGKYEFDKKVFEWAEEEIYRQFNSEKNWLIIDEIGPLEVRKEQGFHQLLLKIFEENNEDRTNLLFVVRDFLVDEFLTKYQLNEAKILPKFIFKDKSPESLPLPQPLPHPLPLPLTGIVLCGGESKRMNSDKALLQYSEEPQWKKLEKMLKPFCEKVVISVNENQWNNWAKNEEEFFVKDKEKYENNGPFSGLMSVLEDFSDEGFFVVGIDYPYLETKNLVQLFNERDENYDAVCFEKEGFTEPLISIIEAKALVKLKKYFESGENSLSRFLKNIHTKKVISKETDFLKNINTEEDFRNFRKLFR